MGLFGGGGMAFAWMLLLAAAIVVPFWKILPRHGIPAWVSVLAVFPLALVILLWIVAFKDPDAEPGNGV